MYSLQQVGRLGGEQMDSRRKNLSVPPRKKEPGEETAFFTPLIIPSSEAFPRKEKFSPEKESKRQRTFPVFPRR